MAKRRGSLEKGSFSGSRMEEDFLQEDCWGRSLGELGGKVGYSLELTRRNEDRCLMCNSTL